NASQDVARLQGSWAVVRMEEKGSNAPDDLLGELAVEIKGDRISVTTKGTPLIEFRYVLDPTKSPRAIDLTHLWGDEKGKTELAIYEVQGDTARFCVGEKERPRAFGTSKDDDRTLFVIRRKK